MPPLKVGNGARLCMPREALSFVYLPKTAGLYSLVDLINQDKAKLGNINFYGMVVD